MHQPDVAPGVARERSLAAEQDLLLAEGCRRGDLAAYEKLYQLHSGRLKSIARNLLGNTAEAEEAVQEVFLRVFRGIASFRGQSSFATWMYRILMNWCQDTWRSRRRVVETADVKSLEPLARAPSTNPPLRLALEAELARLKPRLRHVFLMYEVEGFSHAEIAGTLGVSEGASKNLLYEAKRHCANGCREPSKFTTDEHG